MYILHILYKLPKNGLTSHIYNINYKYVSRIWVPSNFSHQIVFTPSSFRLIVHISRALYKLKVPNKVIDRFTEFT